MPIIKELDMRQIYGVLSALVMVLGLAACSTPDRSTDSSWSRPSGVEIYGEMDAGVGTVRQSR
ncbi:hypothetical protein DUD43_07005 [Alcaligenes faecalis]|nr:hypothetical protein DUD43_07005 [Alcaligenes faecalis]